MSAKAAPLSARKLLEGAGVLYSDRESFNKLANLFGFFGLPV